MAVALADAFLRLHADTRDLPREAEKAGKDAGQKYGKGFSDNARPRDAKGRFVSYEREAGTSGTRAGGLFSRMFSRAAGKAKTGGTFAALAGEITSLGAVQTVAAHNTSIFARAWAAVNIATGIAEPALAGLLVTMGGLVAATAAAAAGAGAYAVALGPVIAQTGDVIKAQETLDKARQTAEVNYQAALKAGTAPKKAAQARTQAMQQAQLAYNAAVGAAPKPIRAFAQEVTSAKNAYKSWADSLAGTTLAPLQIGLSQVSPVLRAIRPLVLAAAGAFTTLMTEMSRKIEAGGLERVVTKVLPYVRPVILDLGHAIGNLVAGIWGIAKAFLPVSTQITGGVVKLTARFKEWANSLPSHSGFQSLMKMFQNTTPLVNELLRNLVITLTNVSRALIGIATPANSAMLVQLLLPLSQIMKVLSGNQALLQTVLYFMMFRKVLGPVTGLLGPAFKGTGLLATAFKELRSGVGMVTVAMNLLKVAFLTNPVGIVAVAIAALAAAFVVLYQRSAGFRNVMKEIGIAVLGFVKIALTGFKFVVDAYLAMVGTIIHAAATMFGWVPGLGGKLKAADRAFSGFRDSVNAKFDSMNKAITEWQNKLRDSEETSANARKHIVADFIQQAQASDRATRGVTSLSNAVTAGGKHSDQAQAARHRLIEDMTKAGIKASTARTDVDRYTTAVDKNGKNSDQARAARTRLIKDILNASNNSARGRTDMDRLTNAIRQHGRDSDQARGARTRLIKDLINSGLDAKEARRLVDTMSDSIKKLHGKRVNIEAHGSGSGGIVFKQTFTGQKKVDRLIFAAEGMKVPGYGGGDKYPAMLEGGETVVPKTDARRPEFVAWAKLRGIPGYASGGFVGPEKAIAKTPGFMVGAETRFVKEAIRRGVAAEKEKLLAWLASQAGGGPANWKTLWNIVRSAGIPGLTLTSAARPGDRGSYHATGQAIDVSSYGAGSTDPRNPMNRLYQWLYKNYHRASLELIHWPYGGIKNGKDVAGSFWPTSVWLQHKNHVHWAAALGGGGGPSPKGPLQDYAKKLLDQYGWRGQWGAFNALVMGESGWRVNATNPSSGAYGIPQALPGSKMASAGADWRTSGYTQLRWMMNYIKSTYGSPARAYAMWSARSPHWYGNGGVITEPILGVGRSGRQYMFGEHGKEETVIPGRVATEAQFTPAGIEARLDRLIRVMERNAADTASGLASALDGAAGKAAHHARWSVR